MDQVMRGLQSAFVQTSIMGVRALCLRMDLVVRLAAT